MVTVDPLAHLAATDPAAGSPPPDDGRLRAALVADLAATNRRRRRRNTAVLAGATALALATGALAGSTVLAGPAPVVAGGEGMAGAPAPMGAELARDMAWVGPERVVFTGSGLDTRNGSANAWDLTGPVDGASVAAALVGALDMTGTPTHQDGTWLVGDWASGGPVLQVYPDLATFTFWDPAADAFRCDPQILPAPADTPASDEVVGLERTAAEPRPAALAPEATSGSGTAPVAPGCDPAGPAPSQAHATALVSAVLEAAGLPVPDRFDASDDGATVYLTGYLRVGGLDSDVTVHAAVTADGISSLSGPAAPPRDLGAYPVVSAAQAVERLGDPRFGGTRQWVGGQDVPVGAADEAGEPGEHGRLDPSGLEPGAGLPWPVAQVTITGAQLVQATYTTAGGGTFLAPTWRLSGDDGSVWTVIAVDAGHLDMRA